MTIRFSRKNILTLDHTMEMVKSKFQGLGLNPFPCRLPQVPSLLSYTGNLMHLWVFPNTFTSSFPQKIHSGGNSCVAEDDCGLRVDGFWSGWSVWGECSSSCIPEGPAPVRARHRFCSNPAPSSSPPGNSCPGDGTETETCNHLPHCAVDGGWGSWSAFSSCPVTCGVGLQVSVRRCDSPAPKHGGQPCAGEGRRTSVCNTNVHCPVDGVWSQWSEWAPCRYPFRGKDIHCQKIGGSQSRERSCLHRAHKGTICSGEALTETRVCYDVDKCYLKGTWDGWDQWSLCSPACGERSQRFRMRACKPDYSKYSPTIGRQREEATFFGKPLGDCGPTPDGGSKFEVQPCLNVPPCT
ncbi:hypothetical protein PBY51_008424 [Eleginops maclovinus]|uniref:Uncharacterized protein n=1 Tax=Eleginops maclovinus TaxID=56733 RepID=A0AAN8AEF6_ELEMC|nr:hypothetical protein PBY51_008424 [Eleginops maclovinus]